jgi:phenylalanyl-tRNA synthetase alpha chain
MQDIILLKEKAKKSIFEATDLTLLDALRVDYLGKKGQLTEVLKGVSQLSAEEKPKVGQWVNEAKREISQWLEEKSIALQSIYLKEKIARERIDITLPGRSEPLGSLHPVTLVKDRIIAYFSQFGFDLVEGPEIEDDFYNFEALNIPAHHPAKSMHDTFYFGDGRLLRTHTSPVQIRTMQQQKPPFRLIAPGRVYRCESDLTHTPMFHQIEGLWIDDSVTLSGLKGLLDDFFAYFFGQKLEVRFRPSYFPFTEPSAEVDIQCTRCQGAGCRSCKFTGWLEVMGCGMVHPNVLKSVHLSPDDVQGWAFGMGLDRLAMLYFGIDDLRLLFENDLNVLKQF